MTFDSYGVSPRARNARGEAPRALSTARGKLGLGVYRSLDQNELLLRFFLLAAERRLT
jgi:hypothetical protein